MPVHTSVLPRVLSPVAITNWWLPPNHALHGLEIDRLFHLIFWTTAAVFVAVHVVLMAFLLKYRHRPGQRRARFVHGNTKVEIVWTVVPAIILGTLAILSIRVWNDYARPPRSATDPSVLRVLVIGQQFKWNVVYPGPDGRLGRYLAYPKPTDSTWPGGERFRATNGPAEMPFDKAVETINAYVDAVNPLGKVMDDPAGLDDDWRDALNRDLVVPVNRPVEVHLSSRDVIHDFAVPNLRLKMDAVPGMIGTLSFTPTAVTDGMGPGYFDIVCEELCGTGHYLMQARLFVVSDAEFERRIRRTQTAREPSSSASGRDDVRADVEGRRYSNRPHRISPAGRGTGRGDVAS